MYSLIDLAALSILVYISPWSRISGRHQIKFLKFDIGLFKHEPTLWEVITHHSSEILWKWCNNFLVSNTFFLHMWSELEIIITQNLKDCFKHESSKHIDRRGGHYYWKVVRGCAAVMTPFLQASRRSLAYQFTINALLMCPPFSIFRKNFSSQDANFLNFCSQDPSFFKENPLPRPYFWKPTRHIPTKKSASPSSPGT